MKGRYPKVKSSIMKWRDSNKNEYREYSAAWAKRKYYLKLAMKEFRAILLD